MSTLDEHIPQWYRDWITKDYADWDRALRFANPKSNKGERDWSPYPEWWESTRQKGIPWSEAKPVDLGTFLERFTLHDAYLVGFSTGWAQLIMAVRPDYIHWALPDAIPNPNLLLICFWRVYQTNWSGPDISAGGLILEARSKQVSDDEKSRFLDTAMLHTTLIDHEREYLLETGLHHTFLGLVASRLSVFHDGRAVVLVFDNQGQPITLPNS